MKKGQVVTYQDGHGKRSAAEVTAVVDAGPSGYKILDLNVGGAVVPSVPHVGDAQEGEACWMIQGEEPERRPVEAPVVDPEQQFEEAASGWRAGKARTR